MYLHANAKHGLAGRSCARPGDRPRLLDQSRRCTLLGLAGHRPSLVAPLAGGRPRGAAFTRLPWRPLEPSPPLPARAPCRAPGSHLHLPPEDGMRGRGLSPAAPTRPSRRCCAGPDSHVRRPEPRAGQELRVALSGRPPAHGCLPLCPLRAARPRRHRRSLASGARLDEARAAGRLRLCAAIVDDHSRLPTSSSTTTRGPRPSPALSSGRSPSTPPTASRRSA